MARVETERSIAAPPDHVFSVVAHIEKFQNINPSISNIEFLSESRSGVGTRFTETRIMNGRETTSTMEVTEYEPPSTVRMVCDDDGMILDTIFTVTPQGDGSLLKLNMEARPYKLGARLVIPLIMRMMKNAIEADMDGIRANCEAT